MNENAGGMDQGVFLVDNRADLHEKFLYVSEKSHNLMLEAIDNLSELNLPVLSVKKEELDEFKYDKWKTADYRLNDEIEIELIKGEKIDKADREKYFEYLSNRKHEDHVELMIRNKTIANEPLKPKLEGELVEVDKEGLVKFIQFWDKNDISGSLPYSHHLKEYLDYYDDFKGEKGKIFLFKEEDGKSRGAVFLKEDGYNNGIHISWLQVLTNAENRGIARSILSELKKKYDRIELSAVSKHPTLDYDEAQARLLRLYKSSGLIGASEWDRKIISLDDLEMAGEWQKVEEQIGFDNTKIYRNDLLKLVISKYIDLGEKVSIPLETREKMNSWRLAAKESRELYNQLYSKH